MTGKIAHQVSCKSVDVCRELGLTGRVFADNQQALAITEGPKEVVQGYFEAVSRDILVETILLHINRPIKKREFSDYSVWLNLREAHQFTPCDRVYDFKDPPEADILPKNASTKVRIYTDAYLNTAILAT